MCTSDTAPSPLLRMHDGRPFRVVPCVEPGTPHTRANLRRQLTAGLAQLSSRSRWQRFAGPLHHFSEGQLDYLTRLDGHDCMAWCAAIDTPQGEQGIGLARFVRLAPGSQSAEFAVTVIDAFQGQGVGLALMRRLLASARSGGITRLTGYVVQGNARMFALAAHLGGEVSAADGGLNRVEFRLDREEG